MAENDLTGFLRKSEKSELQGLYEEWINNLDPEIFTGKLFRAKLLSVYEKEAIDAEKIRSKKNALIFHDVLLRSTYEDLSKVRELLVEVGDRVHILLATRFPHRGEPINFAPPLSTDVSGDRFSEQCTDSNTKPVDDDPFVIGIDTGEPMEYELALTAGKATGAIKSIFGTKKQKGEPLQKIDTYYGFRPNDMEASAVSGTGTGLCVVIRNFSEDLEGYAKDASYIRDFFSNILNYDVMEGSGGGDEPNLVNLSYDGFEVALTKVATKLGNELYDRFFLFILSHGDADGIKMNKDGSGKIEDPGKRYKVDDIIAKFTHDKLPSMKDFPKCFFIQACRGEGLAKAASWPSADCRQKESYQPTQLQAMANGRDILVCYPTEAGYFSWVPPTGSWFIRETMHVLCDYYRSEHLLDMMVEAARRVSVIQKPGEYCGQDGSSIHQESVCQMPHYVSTLTKKFYLQYPPQN